MSEDFEFGSISVVSKKKDLSVDRKDILLYSQNKGRKAHVLILVESTNYSKQKITALTIWFNRMFPGMDYDIVSASILDKSYEQIKKDTIYKYYKANVSNFERYLRPYSIVLTMGIALSGITLSDDLSVECFYDYVFNKTYFYSPRINRYVFPIDGFDTLFRLSGSYYAIKDSSRVEFAKWQCGSIIKKYDLLKDDPDIDRLFINWVKTKNDWNAFMHEAFKADTISWDTETSGLLFYKSRIGCMTVSFDGISGWYIPWSLVDIPQWSQMIKDKKQIGANLKFDILMARRMGLTNLKIDGDVIQLGHTLNEMRYNGLKSLTYYYTPYGGYDFALDDYIEKYSPETYLDIPETILMNYATRDAIMTFRANEAMQHQLDWVDRTYAPIHENGWSVRDFYEKLRLPTVNMFTDLEYDGVNVDFNKWKINSKIIQNKIDNLKKEIAGSIESASILGSMVSSFDSFSLEDDDFIEDMDEHGELQSSQKLGKILEANHWECLGRAKAGCYLTGEQQLIRWAQLGHAEAELIQKLRSYLTMQKTFMGKVSDLSTGWQAFLDFSDGKIRIHPSYKSMMNRSFRNACGDPNWQQLPSGALDAYLFKEIVSVPSSDWLMATLDYSSLQVRLCVIDSQEPVLFREYQKDPDLDLHSKTASNVFCGDTPFDIEEIVIKSNGKEIVKFPFEKIKIKRNGNEMEIKASDLIESDELI